MELTDDKQSLINVEVAHGTPEKQLIISLKVPQGTTASEAIELSNIVEEFPAINLQKDIIGIFSKPLDGKSRPSPEEYVLEEKDRVEIYRPLIIDPKAARLERADKKKNSRTQAKVKGKSK
ncbi:MAG: RnfH family protein [Gammaproteobacteria bacterium]|nr:RnfH family protein [Gammaproteobacteria bacterium]MDD9894404.1 RnfH family protein [Gammaproteobacteria bacterium]MDD9960334.1 RnfH family protein [Gammaproteobacteria bacterium]